MANTTNFGWETPDDTDLVKDGAAAIRTLGSAIDTSMADLKGGTTGQVLTKNSNTDMDFTWAADASGIPATIFDAKGDLIAASAADTAARLAVGTNGQVLTADSTASTGLAWATPSSGSLTLLSTTSMNGSSNVSVTGISGSHTNLQIQVLDLSLGGAAGTIYVRFNSDTTNYNAVTISTSNSTTIGSTSSGVPLTYAVNMPDQGGNYHMALVNVYNYANTTTYKAFDVVGGFVPGGNNSATMGGGNFRSTSAITSVQVYTSGGTFAGGTVKIYGVK